MRLSAPETQRGEVNAELEAWEDAAAKARSEELADYRVTERDDRHVAGLEASGESYGGAVARITVTARAAGRRLA